MPESYYTALTLTRIFLSFALIFQSLEYFKIKKVFANNGIWPLGWPYDLWPNGWLIFRLVLSVLILFIHSVFVYLLLIISIIWIARACAKSFNGGSDSMSMVVLMGLSIEVFFPKAGLFYIAIQSLMSYLISGFIKIKNADWRSGFALKAYLQISPYVPLFPSLKSSTYSLLSGLVIVFELFFAFSIVHTPTLEVFLALGLIFHMFVAIVFGLNRFLHIWIATYPALYFLSLYLNRLFFLG